MKYVPGDFYRICARCGFRLRASQTRRTWDGLYVCVPDFETRHPQDFVRGRKDQQAVPDPRPEPLDNLIGPLTTTVTAAASPGAQTITVESSVRFLGADRIGVTLSDGSVERHIVQSVPTATSILMAENLGGSVSVGAVVINYSAVSEADIG